MLQKTSENRIRYVKDFLIKQTVSQVKFSQYWSFLIFWRSESRVSCKQFLIENTCNEHSIQTNLLIRRETSEVVWEARSVGYLVETFGQAVDEKELMLCCCGAESFRKDITLPSRSFRFTRYAEVLFHSLCFAFAQDFGLPLPILENNLDAKFFFPDMKMTATANIFRNFFRHLLFSRTQVLNARELNVDKVYSSELGVTRTIEIYMQNEEVS